MKTTHRSSANLTAGSRMIEPNRGRSRMARLRIAGLVLLICVFCWAGQLRPSVMDDGITSARAPGHARTRKKRPVYHAKSPEQSPQASGTGQEEIGVTLWRLRPSTPSDTGTRMLTQEPDASAPVEMTPERVEVETPLSAGQRVRLSIESSKPGYLYVIDQEQYSDGSKGDPYLIFPTTRMREGNNRVEPGLLVELPDQNDRPNYWTLTRQRPDEVSENLTLLVAPKPIAEIRPSRQPIKLSRDLLKEWQSKWEVQAQHLELEGGAGTQWTEQEKSAGAGGTRMLTQDDPSPQTVYRVNPKPGNPILVRVPLKIGG